MTFLPLYNTNTQIANSLRLLNKQDRISHSTPTKPNYLPIYTHTCPLKKTPLNIVHMSNPSGTGEQRGGRRGGRRRRRRLRRRRER